MLPRNGARVHRKRSCFERRRRLWRQAGCEPPQNAQRNMVSRLQTGDSPPPIRPQFSSTATQVADGPKPRAQFPEWSLTEGDLSSPWELDSPPGRGAKHLNRTYPSRIRAPFCRPLRLLSFGAGDAKELRRFGQRPAIQINQAYVESTQSVAQIPRTRSTEAKNSRLIAHVGRLTASLTVKDGSAEICPGPNTPSALRVRAEDDPARRRTGYTS
jgi:hypothetical protein